MKNDISQFFDAIGAPLSFIVNGVVGGTIWSIYRKLRFWDAVRQIIIGGIVSGYMTPVIIAKTSLDIHYVGFTSFITGMLGMVIVDAIYQYVSKMIEKWKDAIVFINSKK